MRIRFVADVHIGNHKQHGGEVKSGINDRCRRILKALNFAAMEADHLVVLGDLFDTSSPSPQMVRATMNALGGRTSTLMLGNHDMVSADPGDNALAPFDHPDAFGWKVIEQPTLMPLVPRIKMLLVPFRPEPMVDWFAESVGDLVAERAAAEEAPDYMILGFHGGVRDHNTPKYLWSSPDAIDVDLLFDIMRRGKIKLAVCGNWHNARKWERDGMTVIQVGALVPTGFDNAGWEYGYYVDFQTGTFGAAHRQIPTLRFLAMTTDEIKASGERLRNHIGGVYLKVKLAPGQTQEEAEAIIDQHARSHDKTEDSPNILGVSYSAAEEDTAQQEMEAAEAAKTADTLEGALREYVQTMPLPDGVDRSAVESKVLTYITR